MLLRLSCTSAGCLAAAMLGFLAAAVSPIAARAETLEAGVGRGLPQQSVAQFAARLRARHRRRRAAGAVGLPPENLRHHLRRRTVAVARPPRSPAPIPATYSTLSGYNSPVSGGVTVSQTLFNGFQTANRTRQAEAQVLAARETLRVTEQSVLLNAATAYMNLLRDTAILSLQESNVKVLQEQLRQVRDRFNVGEVTRTDVAQSEVARGGRPLAGADGGIQLQNVRRGLSPGYRQQSRQAGAGDAGRSLFAALRCRPRSPSAAPAIRPSPPRNSISMPRSRR